jgi:hypothetical protein
VQKSVLLRLSTFVDDPPSAAQGGHRARLPLLQEKIRHNRAVFGPSDERCSARDPRQIVGRQNVRKGVPKMFHNTLNASRRDNGSYAAQPIQILQ